MKGAQRLRAELEELKSVKRPAVIQAIAEARAHGDLKENAEYHAAREQQGFIEGRIAPLRARIDAALAGGGVDADAATALVELVVERQIALLAEPETEAFARFITREQQEPTAAFALIYDRVMGVMLPMLRQLVAIASHDDPAREAVGFRTFAIAGQFLIFRVGRAAVLRQMGWRDIGPAQVQAITPIIQHSVRAMLQAARLENSR